ncbi:MAG TPA: Dabb family protein [Candidatus Saccharimonadia bacterium]|nr:Dabb family protein [Candidatus Saccharimonadia bacterium]
MKTLPAFLAAVFALLMSTTSASAADAPYRHVVLFKFKDGTTPAQVKSVEDAFRGLPGKIDTIVDFEFGTNVSPEGKDGGFTHCFFVTFKDKAGLEVYLPHAAHKEFGAALRPYLDKVLVIDYVAGK